MHKLELKIITIDILSRPLRHLVELTRKIYKYLDNMENKMLNKIIELDDKIQEINSNK